MIECPQRAAPAHFRQFSDPGPAGMRPGPVVPQVERAPSVASMSSRNCGRRRDNPPSFEVELSAGRAAYQQASHVLPRQRRIVARALIARLGTTQPSGGDFPGSPCLARCRPRCGPAVRPFRRVGVLTEMQLRIEMSTEKPVGRVARRDRSDGLPSLKAPSGCETGRYARLCSFGCATVRAR